MRWKLCVGTDPDHLHDSSLVFAGLRPTTEEAEGQYPGQVTRAAQGSDAGREGVRVSGSWSWSKARYTVHKLPAQGLFTHGCCLDFVWWALGLVVEALSCSAEDWSAAAPLLPHRSAIFTSRASGDLRYHFLAPLQLCKRGRYIGTPQLRAIWWLKRRPELWPLLLIHH